MSSGSFSRSSQPPPPPGQLLQQPPFQVNTMDLSMGGYPSAAAAAAAVMRVEAYPSAGNVFGRLDYQPQTGVNGRPQKRRRQHQQHNNDDGGDGGVSAAPQAPMGSAAENQQQQSMGQFGILAPTPIPASHQQLGGGSILQPPPVTVSAMGQPMVQFAQAGTDSGGKPGGKIVVDPPDLDAWREKLVNVDEMIVLTQEQYETYFPHVDNVYSHRSTQKYKRKPFISHYWDCRMKGRPPGTPKTEDPNKKRRRRSARERDLCDVKIKITEYFPSPNQPFQLDSNSSGTANGDASSSSSAAAIAARYQSLQQPFWTIQRVNGNGGNGKSDGVAGPHKHTLAKSDEIKKSSVQRHVAALDREKKKTQVPPRRASGAAAATVRKHAREHEMKLYAACHCPFSQRVWLALEAKGLGYQYCETEPNRKRPVATAASAVVQVDQGNSTEGRVPVIRHGEWECAESAVILEYMEDLDSRVPLLPRDAQLKATCRFWINHINTNFVPSFFTLLQNTDLAKQATHAAELQKHLDTLVQAADIQGPYFLGATLSLVDVHLAPFALRLRTVLHARRGLWPAAAEAGSRWAMWLDALTQNTHIKATTSLDDLYAETVDTLINRPL